MQFGSRARAVEQEIPSIALRAGSSLRLKNGFAQDDTFDKEFRPRCYRRVRKISRKGSANDLVLVLALRFPQQGAQAVD